MPNQTSGKAPVVHQAEVNEATIDLVELGYRLLDKWKMIVAFALIGTLIAGIITFAFITPLYQAKSTIYVVSRRDSAINLSDLQLGDGRGADLAASGLPLLLMTALPPDDPDRAGLAVPVLTKPFLAAELAAQLERLPVDE